MRLIDADWVLENAENVVLKILKNEPAERAIKHQGHMFRSLIKRAPTIDAEPVRHGRWEWYEDWGPSTWLEPPDCLAAEWRCSACKKNLADYIDTHAPGETVYMDNSENKPTLAYCPHCGAKMHLPHPTNEEKEATT